MAQVRKKSRSATKKKTVKRKVVRRKKAASKSSRSGARGGWWWRFPLRFGLTGLVIGLVGFLLVILIYGNIARSYPLDEVGKMPERSIVFDRKGREVGRLHGANRLARSLDAISPMFAKALLAREDSRFYNHSGVDYIGVARSVVRNVKAGGVREGASTITMQLARNSFDDLMSQRSLHRKLIEVMLAKRIERKYSKDEILTHYVNRIFFGSGIYGIEQASRSYFGKPASDMTLGESAMLAGIIRGPNRFSPFRHYERAISERDTVLARMVKLEMVSAAEAEAEKKKKIKVLDQQKFASQDSYALDAVRRDLDDLLEQEEVEDGGLQIQTHLDIDLQALAEQALERGLAEVELRGGYAHQTMAAYEKIYASSAPERRPKPDYLQGAVVVVDNIGGGILAIVGGRNFKHSKFNRALYANRQVGSVFKPFVYAAAFDNGLMPGTLVDDGPLRRGEIIGHEGSWSPRNSDGTHIGLQPAEVGLIRSRNTMSVRVGNWAGTERLMKMAHYAGFSKEIRPSAQLYIGNLEADLKTLTSAYTIFPGAGRRLPALAIADIINSNGDTFYSTEAVRSYPVIAPGACQVVSDTLEKVIDSGTGAGARQRGFREDAGGKTGTTNNFVDAWFIGYTDKITVGVWIGLDRPRRIAAGAYGGALALPVWTDIMKGAEKLGYKAGKLESKVQMTNVELCRHSGKFATKGCRRGGHDYDAHIPYSMAPRDNCSLHGYTTARKAMRVKDESSDSDGGERGGLLRRIFGD
ncbi:MAG: penicillin-binding protein 1A [Verrucomicrobiales bacterium]|jgi:penicillin-binding protein 1A